MCDAANANSLTAAVILTVWHLPFVNIFVYAQALKTVKLLGDAPVYSGRVQKELVTPTGALIVSSYASAFGPIPPMSSGITSAPPQGE